MSLHSRISSLLPLVWVVTAFDHAYASGLYISPGYTLILWAIPVALVAVVAVARRLSRSFKLPLAALVVFVILLVAGAAVVLSSSAPLGGLGSTRIVVEFILLVVIPAIGSSLLTWSLRTPAKRSTRVVVDDPNSKSRLRIEKGRVAASAHLLDPTYIVDYARAIGSDLDSVHGLLRAGQLFSYWHDGILFVGQRKVDTPNPSLQGTRDEAVRP